MEKKFLALQEEQGGIPIQKNAKDMEAAQLQPRDFDRTGTTGKRRLFERLGIFGGWLSEIISGRCPNFNLQ